MTTDIQVRTNLLYFSFDLLRYMTRLIQEDSSIKFEPMIKPCFPKATEILFFTGNTLTLFPLLKKANSTVTEEVSFVISLID